MINSRSAYLFLYTNIYRMLTSGNNIIITISREYFSGTREIDVKEVNSRGRSGEEVQKRGQHQIGFLGFAFGSSGIRC